MDLQFDTGSPRANAALETIVAAFEDAFAGERARYALLGSYATGTGRDSSDVDLLVVFQRSLSEEGRLRAAELVDRLAREVEIDADIGVCSVGDCPPVWAVCIGAGRTIFGDQDLEPPLPSIEDYSRAVTSEVLSLMRGVRPGQPRTAPLGLPNPQLPLFGYEAKPLRDADGRWAPSIKAMSMIAYWGATALIAHRAGRYVASKDHVIAAYRKFIADEWTDLLVDIERICHRKYDYVIPGDEAGRAEVRQLAFRVVTFENHLLNTLPTDLPEA